MNSSTHCEEPLHVSDETPNKAAVSVFVNTGSPKKEPRGPLPFVEVAGIEPASISTSIVLLRAQPIGRFRCEKPIGDFSCNYRY